jgi:ABC-type sulfate transport system permease component
VRQGFIKSPLPWLGGLIVLYLAIPVIGFVVRLVGAQNRGFADLGLFPSLFVSLESASISLALITLLGVPLAYLLARSAGRVASFVGLVVMLPLALPPLMSGILLIYLVGPYTYLGRLFDGRLTMSLTGVVLAQTFCAAPFLIVAARSAFGTVDPAMLDVASTLGHSEFSRFRRVALPIAGPGIRAGMLLAWLRAFGEYGAVIVLAYHPFSLPVYTYNQFSGAGLPTTVAPTALALGVAVVVVVLSRLPLRGISTSSVVPPEPVRHRPSPRHVPPRTHP